MKNISSQPGSVSKAPEQKLKQPRNTRITRKNTNNWRPTQNYVQAGVPFTPRIQVLSLA